jgi:hypothetical protein
MEQNISRQIRFLQVYAGFLTVLVAALVLLYLRKENKSPHFKEIDAERINIVEGNGLTRMVISNQELQHPGSVNGKIVAHRERPAGMIFFNDDGDECGGLVFDGNKNEANMVYSIDQYRNDQVMQLQYAEDSNSKSRLRSYGLKIWDRRDDFTLSDLLRLDDSLKSLHDTAVYQAVFRKMQAEGLIGQQRLFLGRTKSREVGLFINDDKGRPRIRIGLDSQSKVIFQVTDSNDRSIPFHP